MKAPVHPGEILLEEFLKPLGMTMCMSWLSLYGSRPTGSAR
jgi:hypothetical protein